MCATGAEETGIVEPHHDHDSIAHDPFINRAQRDLTVEIRLIRQLARPKGCFESHSRSGHAHSMTIADAHTRGCFNALGRITHARLTREDQFNVI